MPRLRLSGLVLVLASGPAFSHETLPADWCPLGTHPVAVGEFHFTPGELAAWQAAQAGQATGSTSDCGNPKTCGIVDEWFWAQDMATAHCGGTGLRGGTPEDAIPFVEAPSSFNHERHHDRYRFHEGPLVGQCVVCRDSTTPGVTLPGEDG